MDARRLTQFRKDLASFLDDVVGTLGNAAVTLVRSVCPACCWMVHANASSRWPLGCRKQKVESGAEDYEQALQQFTNLSPGDEQTVRDGLQRWIGRRFGTSAI